MKVVKILQFDQFQEFENERIKLLNNQQLSQRDFVVYWMQATQRAEHNQALDYAIMFANKLNQPLLVYFGITNSYPEANQRHYYFMFEGLKDVQDIYGATLPFLSTEYERFMRKRCEWLPIDPIHQVSFILAGRTEKDRTKPFRLYFLWTKKKLPQIDGDEIAYAFSLPRRMGLEFQLNKMCKENVPPKEILEKISAGMERLKNQGEAGSNLSYAMITQEGYQSLNP